jgi:hypothetical protein
MWQRLSFQSPRLQCREVVTGRPPSERDRNPGEDQSAKRRKATNDLSAEQQYRDHHGDDDRPGDELGTDATAHGGRDTAVVPIGVSLASGTCPLSAVSAPCDQGHDEQRRKERASNTGADPQLDEELFGVSRAVDIWIAFAVAVAVDGPAKALS